MTRCVVATEDEKIIAAIAAAKLLGISIVFQVLYPYTISIDDPSSGQKSIEFRAYCDLEYFTQWIVDDMGVCKDILLILPDNVQYNIYGSIDSYAPEPIIEGEQSIANITVKIIKD